MFYFLSFLLDSSLLSLVFPHLLCYWTDFCHSFRLSDLTLAINTHHSYLQTHAFLFLVTSLPPCLGHHTALSCHHMPPAVRITTHIHHPLSLRCTFSPREGHLQTLLLLSLLASKQDRRNDRKARCRKRLKKVMVCAGLIGCLAILYLTCTNSQPLRLDMKFSELTQGLSSSFLSK